MLLSLAVAFQLQVVPTPIDAGWELSGAGTQIAPSRGAPVLVMDNGRAVRRDVRLQDGVIEFDVALTPTRSFVYVQFRMESDTEFEEIYFRPHKSELPDAVQYNPVWRGDSFWQLWHGVGATAAPRFAFDDVTHVRLVLAGRTAALYLDGGPSPVMTIPLAREPRPGYVAVRAFTPDTAALRGRRAATFSNFSVRSGRPADAPAAVAAPTDALPGGIQRWQISPPFAAVPAPLAAIADSLLRGRERWPVYPVEPSGVVAIGRHQMRPRPVGGAIARLVVRSQGERLQRLYLGYSDYATVFVNGRPLFAGDAHYSFDAPRQEGLIGRSQSTIWLPLRDGENEVLIAVIDGFGGWGLTGRLEPLDGGVLVEPPR